MIALEMPRAQEACDLRSALLTENQTNGLPAELARADERESNTPPSLLALGRAAQAHAELPALHKRAGNASAADRETKESQRLKGGAIQPLYKE
jgi:hypothetical protein